MFLFVYGSLKRGFPLHKEFLAGEHLCGEGWVDGWKMISLGLYPVIQPGAGLVWGEVYDVGEEVVARIEQHPMIRNVFTDTLMVAKIGQREYRARTYTMREPLDLGVYKMIDSGRWEDKAAVPVMDCDDWDLEDDDFDEDFDDDFEDDFEDFEFEEEYDPDFDDDFDDDDFDEDFDYDYDYDYDEEDDEGIENSFPASTS